MQCFAFTPYDVGELAEPIVIGDTALGYTHEVSLYAAENLSADNHDNTLHTVKYLTEGVDEPLSSTSRVWAVWSLSEVTPVPVPAAVWLFGSALIGLAGMKCKN